MRHLLLTGLVLIFIIWLLRRKVSMTAVMPIGSLLLALLYLLPLHELGRSIYLGIASPKSVEMTATLALTMVMENLLRTTGMLKRMVTSLSAALPDRRMVMAALPAMIGMLPSPGGAVFSAPMVAQAAEGITSTPEQKALINYWYRHIWEYISPLYPGIILVAGLSGISTQQLFISHLPFAITVIFAGAWFCFHNIARPETEQNNRHEKRLKQFGTFLLMSSPILISLSLVVAFNFSAVLALSGGVAILFIVHRYKPLQILKTLHESLSFKALFLVVGIMIFQEVLRSTGSLAGISSFFAASDLPIPLLMLIIPFIAGVMTGLTVGYVGITFPLLLPLMGADGHPDLWLEALAFAGGFAGVMLSPVHLCFVLTREYFSADTAIVYRRLLAPSLIVLAAAMIPYLLYH